MNLTTIEWLTLLYNLLMLLTFLAIARQVAIQARSNAMNSVESSYDRFLELDRMVINHPRLQLLTVRPEVLNTIKAFDEEQLRCRAYIEFIFDAHELMYIRQKNNHYMYQGDYIKTLVKNPKVVEYWTQMRGNFRSDFSAEVDKALGCLAAGDCNR